MTAPRQYRKKYRNRPAATYWAPGAVTAATGKRSLQVRCTKAVREGRWLLTCILTEDHPGDCWWCTEPIEVEQITAALAPIREEMT